MPEATPGDVVMLGLPGFRVLGVCEVDGELEVTVETDDELVGCSGCGVRARSKGRKQVVVRDVGAFGRRARLRWVKRRWRCPEPACPVRTWTEQHPAVGRKATLTERAREQACRRVGRDGSSVALVARDLGVGWHTVMRAVRDRGQRLVDDPGRLDGVAALGHRLATGLADGDPDGQVAAAWQAKEALRDVYRAATVRAARTALAVFYDHCHASSVPEVRRLARTIRRWEPEVLAWHTTGGASNGPAGGWRWSATPRGRRSRSTSPASSRPTSACCPSTCCAWPGPPRSWRRAWWPIWWPAACACTSPPSR